jgi:hypothetical protein
MGHFIRPKDTNKDDVTDSKTKLRAEAIGVIAEYENEYIEPTGFDPTTDGHSGGKHHKDPTRREAEPNAPLPTGGRSAGISSPGVRGWRTPSARRGSMPRKGR